METKGLYTLDSKIDTQLDTEQNYTIKDVMERYELKTRQTFYTWTKALNLAVSKDSDGKSILTPEQISLMDELHDHLRNGGAIKSFTPSIPTEIINQSVVTVNSTLDTTNNKTSMVSTISEAVGENIGYRQLELFESIINKVTELMPISPISHWDELNKAVNNGYILTTKEVKEILGTKPTGDEWIRGAFKFTKVGKIGNQIGWNVTNINIKE